MNVAYKRRGALGERFDELLNLVILWAAVRNGANFVVREIPGDVLKPYKEALFRRYQSGRLKGPAIPLARAQLLGGGWPIGLRGRGLIGGFVKRGIGELALPGSAMTERFIGPPWILIFLFWRKGFRF